MLLLYIKQVLNKKFLLIFLFTIIRMIQYNKGRSSLLLLYFKFMKKMLLKKLFKKYYSNILKFIV